MEERHSIDKDLPLHWYRYFDDDGGEYFYNDLTGETTWDHPGPPEPLADIPATNPNWQPPPTSSSNPFGDDDEAPEVSAAAEEDAPPPEPLTSHPTVPPSDLSLPSDEPQPGSVAAAASGDDPHDHDPVEDHPQSAPAVEEGAPSTEPTAEPSRPAAEPLTSDEPPTIDDAAPTMPPDEEPQAPATTSGVAVEAADAQQATAAAAHAVDEAGLRPASVNTPPSPAPAVAADPGHSTAAGPSDTRPTSPPTPAAAAAASAARAAAAASSNPFGDDDDGQSDSAGGEESSASTTPPANPPASRPASVVVPTARSGVPVARPLSAANPFGDAPIAATAAPTTDAAVIPVTTSDDALRYLPDAVPTVASPTAAASPPSAAAHNHRVPVEQRRVAPVVAVPADAHDPSLPLQRSSVGAREVRLEKRLSASSASSSSTAANPFGADDGGPSSGTAASANPFGPAPVAPAAAASRGTRPASVQLPPPAPHGSGGGGGSGGGFHHVNMVAALSNPYVDSDSDRLRGDSRSRPSLPPQHFHSHTNGVNTSGAGPATRPVSVPLAPASRPAGPRPSPLAAAFDANAAGASGAAGGAAYVNSRYHPASTETLAAAAAVAAAPATGARTPLPPPPLRPSAAAHAAPPPPVAPQSTATARRSVAVAALGQSTAAMSVDNAQNNAYHLAHPTHPAAPAAASAAQRPQPPPVPPRRRPLPLTPSTSASLSAASPASSSSGAARPPRSTFPFPEQLQQLVAWGVKPAFAEACLLDAQGHVDAAFALVHEGLVAALAHTDLTSGSVSHQWYPRVNVSIRSWLPNFIEAGDKDYHTVYVIHVTLHFDDTATAHGRFQTWQLLYRYQRFRTLYYALQPLVGRVLARRHHEAIASGIYDVPDFPLAGLGDWMFGISDEQRNQRMTSLHAWCEAIVVHPLLMTHAEIRRLVWTFFDVDAHL